jgi:hypothetical protein
MKLKIMLRILYTALFLAALFIAKTFKDPGFHQEYKKLTGDEATPLMADEMEKAVKGLPRDPEIVELFKKIAGGGPLPPR